jgi:methanogenic corrinoid protein MtbC1
MKFKILLALIFVNLMQAQKFYFPKTAVTDSLILEKQMPALAQVIPNLQSKKYRPKMMIIRCLFRLQMATKDYKKSLATFLKTESVCRS